MSFLLSCRLYEFLWATASVDPWDTPVLTGKGIRDMTIKHDPLRYVHWVAPKPLKLHSWDSQLWKSVYNDVDINHVECLTEVNESSMHHSLILAHDGYYFRQYTILYVYIPFLYCHLLGCLAIYFSQYFSIIMGITNQMKMLIILQDFKHAMKYVHSNTFGGTFGLVSDTIVNGNDQL